MQLYNGITWVDTGTATYTGPVTMTYVGKTVACNVTMTLSLSGGLVFSASTITSMSGSGSNPCSGVVASNMPWSITPGTYTGPNPPFPGAPTLTPPLSSFAMSGVRIFIPAPLNVNCPSTTGSGTINGVLDSDGRIVFKSAIGPCAIQTMNGSFLTPSLPVRVI